MANYGKIAPTLAWNQNADSDLAGYIIHVRRDDTQVLTNTDVGLTSTPSSPTYTYTGITTLQRWYYFSISAYDTSNNRSDRTAEQRFYVSDPYTRDTLSKIVSRKG